MSTPMFRTGAEKNRSAFWWFYLHRWARKFALDLFFVYAAQILRWGTLLNAEEKKGISKRGFGGEGPQRGPF